LREKRKKTGFIRSTDEFLNVVLSLIQSNFIALIKGLEKYVKENSLN
jgi:hypothetical protein